MSLTLNFGWVGSAELHRTPWIHRLGIADLVWPVKSHSAGNSQKTYSTKHTIYFQSVGFGGPVWLGGRGKSHNTHKAKLNSIAFLLSAYCLLYYLHPVLRSTFLQPTPPLRRSSRILYALRVPCQGRLMLVLPRLFNPDFTLIRVGKSEGGKFRKLTLTRFIFQIWTLRVKLSAH